MRLDCRRRKKNTMTTHDRAHKGGKARATKLTPAERSASARHAVQARWAQYRQRQEPTATVSHAQGVTRQAGEGREGQGMAVSLVIQHTEIVYQPVPYPVAAYPILSQRTWTEPLCLDASHVAAFQGKATAPHCPSCEEITAPPREGQR